MAAAIASVDWTVKLNRSLPEDLKIHTETGKKKNVKVIIIS